MLCAVNDEEGIKWPENVIEKCSMLWEMCCWTTGEDNNIQKKERVVIPTAPSKDVLVFLGAFIEWDVMQEREKAEEKGRQQKKERSSFFDSVVNYRNGLFGDLIRTADFLEYELFLKAAAEYVEAKKDTRRIKEALIG